MALDTYANLQTAVLNWLARPGDALVAPSIPDMIRLFEAEANRVLATRFQESRVTLVGVGGVDTLALPTDYMEARELVLIGPTQRFRMEYAAPAQIDEAFANDTTEQPKLFTIEGANIRLRPPPDAAYSFSLDYIASFPALSNTNPSNQLLATYPDAYLFGTLAEATAFIGEDDRIALWIQRRDATFKSIMTEDQGLRWSGGPLVMKTDTGNP